MGRGNRSREAIEEKLAGLEEVYDDFAVNQRTLALPGNRFTAVRERGADRPIYAFIEVYNDDGEVLQVGEGASAELPGRRVGMDEPPERRVRKAVREQTGVECSVESLDRVTIRALRCTDDAESDPVYHLVAVFEGSHIEGTPDEGAGWLSPTETAPRQ